jgi:DNA-binding LytR/AlgR family response regulator
MKTKILIVDDEPLAQDVMEAYISKLPELEIVAKCNNALDAFSVLNKEKVDLMLLDINMPEISGMDFLKTLKNPPRVIFTTAYTEFAVESYELDVVDYLVKPISFERFFKSINKAKEIIEASASGPQRHGTIIDTKENFMFVKSDGKLVKIDLSKLWFVEGLKDYIRLWTETGKVIVHSTMKNFEELLSSLPAFVRVNKSYIVNIKHVNEVDGNVIRIKNEMITIGNTYKEKVSQIFDANKLL